MGLMVSNSMSAIYGKTKVLEMYVHKYYLPDSID